MRKKLGSLKYLSIVVLLYAVWATYICKSYRILQVDYRVGMLYSQTYLYAYALAVFLFVIGHICCPRLFTRRVKSKNKKLEVDIVRRCGCGALITEGSRFCINCGKELIQ